jgi:glutathione S-transferase
MLDFRLLIISSALLLVSAFQIPTNRKLPNTIKDFPRFSPSHLMSTSTEISSWDDLRRISSDLPVGSALNNEVALRLKGKGSPHVQSKLRLFSSDTPPKITLYRDHAGWCPYCEKTMLLIEEKAVPMNIELVPMRSYGDKPEEFMRLVRGGMLPALTVEKENGSIQTITESQVIMELLDTWHSEADGFKPMLPKEEDSEGWARYDKLARLERELFSWWCTLIFRPEGPRIGGSGLMNMLGNKNKMSGAMSGFLDCIEKVDAELNSTQGPWFFESDYPTMIDFVFISHVERMLASCAYWKGLDLRSGEMRSRFGALNRWLDAFDKRESYLAFKSDYYTNVKDIPPQYGPGFDGGFEENRKKYANMIVDMESQKLPLPFDDPLQPLFKGPPLPLCVLNAVGISADSDGSFENADANMMAKACRQMAGWKLASNGVNVSKFAARGGSKGAKNVRKPFGAELADPYANTDEEARPYVDVALRIVCKGLLGNQEAQEDNIEYLMSLTPELKAAVPSSKTQDVKSSLIYLRDRVGVPRDLPLASARYLRAHLSWAISTL